MTRQSTPSSLNVIKTFLRVSIPYPSRLFIALWSSSISLIFNSPPTPRPAITPLYSILYLLSAVSLGLDRTLENKWVRSRRGLDKFLARYDLTFRRYANRDLGGSFRDGFDRAKQGFPDLQPDEVIEGSYPLLEGHVVLQIVPIAKDIGQGHFINLSYFGPKINGVFRTFGQQRRV